MKTAALLAILAAFSLSAHLWLIPQLNIIEDESAYMQDAAQISAHILPFRDFGGTKGPLWLFIFKGWQTLCGRSLFASRLFPSLAHILSIILLWYLARSLRLSATASAAAAAMWALAPVAVSLTTNVTHIPLELTCVLGAFLCMRQPKLPYVYAAVCLLWAALLMRATAIAFAPAFLILLLVRPDRWRAFGAACAGGALLLAMTVAIIFPLYGWPKTAFFFNADATLIAHAQQQVYAKQGPSSPLQGLYDAALPLREDSPLVLALALLYVPLAVRQVWQRPRSSMLPMFVAAWVGAFILFYKGWGRSATPFYPLESIPALTLMAGATAEAFFALANSRFLRRLLIVAGICVFAIASLRAYQHIPGYQYRGTVEVKAAQQVASYLRAHVPAGESIFTGQPVFAYLAYRPLYGNYTHPGWYLSERAGYLPAEIRRVFLPDFDALPALVERDVDWIVVDWRTNDVYFNANTPATAPLRSVLSRDFGPVATVRNPASRDIVIYQRLNR